MRNRLARLFLVAALALLVSACGGGDAGSDSADPGLVEQGNQALDTSRFVTTTTSPAGGAGGASEAAIGDDDETGPSGADDATGTTTLPQNEVSQEEAVDDMFTAMRTFNSCLEDEGQPFIGYDATAPASDPSRMRQTRRRAGPSRPLS